MIPPNTLGEKIGGLRSGIVDIVMQRKAGEISLIPLDESAYTPELQGASIITQATVRYAMTCFARCIVFWCAHAPRAFAIKSSRVKAVVKGPLTQCRAQRQGCIATAALRIAPVHRRHNAMPHDATLMKVCVLLGLFFSKSKRDASPSYCLYCLGSDCLERHSSLAQ